MKYTYADSKQLKKKISFLKHDKTKKSALVGVSVATLIASGGSNTLHLGDVTTASVATEDTVLTADTSSIFDFDGPGSYNYQWQIGGADIMGANSSTYSPTQADVDSGNGITVKVSFTDGSGYSEVSTSVVTSAVVNINDLPQGSVTIAGTPQVGQTLTANNTLSDEDGLGTFSYQWTSNGAVVGSGATYAVQSSDAGNQITVKITYTDVYNTAETVTSSATGVVNNAPAGGLTITGTPIQGGTLGFVNSITDADGLGVMSYQWYSNGTLIIGATGTTYTLLATDVGHVITVQASYLDGGGTTETVTSAATTAVYINSAPTVPSRLTSLAIEDDPAYTIDMLAGATDDDAGETATLTVANVVGLPAGVTYSGTTITVDPSHAGFQSLRAGSALTAAINYDIVDVNGASVAQRITLSITGINDTPTATALVFAANEDDPSFTINMLVGATDVDSGETATLTVANVAGLVAGVTYTGTGISVDPSDAAFQSLAVGTTQVIIVTYDIVDVQGAIFAQTATITITGTNEVPTVAAALTSAANEDDAAYTINMLTGAADVDAGETASLSVANVTGLVAGVTLSGTNISVNPSDAGFQGLAVGATQIIIVAYDVVDVQGASVTQTLTITITGTNDVPTATALISAANRGDPTYAINMLSGATDLDTGETASLIVTNVAGLSAGVTYNGTSISVDPSDAAFQGLAVGGTQIIIVTYDVVDVHGASVAQTATITITRANEIPTVSAALTSAANEDDSAYTVDMLAGAVDADAGETATLTVANVTGLIAGVTQSGTNISVDPSDASFQSLAVGATQVIVVTFDVVDIHGASVAQTVTITITGTNDGPVAVDDAYPLTPITEIDVNTQTNGDQRIPSITGLTNGNFVVTWQSLDGVEDQSSYGIKARIFDAHGSPIGNEFLVNDGFENGTQNYAEVAALAGGGFAITWNSINNGGHKVEIYDSAGIVTVPEFNIGVIVQGYVIPDIIALPNGGFVTMREGRSITINDNSDAAISAQIFDALGNAQSGEFLVNTTTLNNQVFASGDSFDDGSFIITWASNDGGNDASGYGIKAQIIDASGTLIGAEIQVNNSTNSTQIRSEVATLSNGNFIITWLSDDGVDTSNYGIKARMFNASGTPLAPEFLVNSTQYGYQWQPQIEQSHNGGFVINWRSNDNGGSSVRAQFYDETGGAIGSELILAQNAGDGPTWGASAAALTNLNGGGYAIAWVAQDSGDINIKAKIFGSDGTPLILNAAFEDSITIINNADLLANDTDVDGDTLSIISVSPTSAAGALLILNGNGTISYDANGQFETLAAGDTTTDTFTYTISDGNGGTDIATVTITVVGENDAPTATALVSAASEDDSAYTINMLAGATDIDSGETATLTVANVTGLITGVTYTGTNISVDPSHAVFQSLTLGATQIIIVAYDIVDIHGASVAQTATITITGTNDAPTATALISAANRGDPNYTINMLSGAADIDTGETASLIVTNVAGLSAGVTYNGTSISVDPSDAAFQSLAVGGTQVIIVTYDVVDVHGASVAQTATITITRVNEIPTVSAAITSAANEDDSVYTVDMLAGAVDADAGETATLTVANVTGLIAGVTQSGTNISVDPSDASFQSLALGATQVIVVTYDVVDIHGASVTQTATITITGTNDAPTATALVSAANEDDPSYTINMLSGALDVDTGETSSLTVANVTGLTGGVTYTGTNISVDPSHAAFQSLVLGATQVITVTYDIVDIQGASVAQTATITITGTNDAPTATALVSAANEDNPAYTINMLTGATDADAGETATLTVANVTGLVAGVTQSGSTISVDPSHAGFQSLALGATQVVIVTYDVVDIQGASVTQTATITITGTNDAPTATALVSATTEDDPAYTINMLAGATDVDTGETTSLTVANVTGLTAGVTFSGTSISVDPSHAAFQGLVAGATQVITVTYDVVDIHGASVAQTATITVTGVDEALYGASGPEFLVNSQHADFQVEPTITGLDGGGFVISWRTNNIADDGSGGAIKAQIYDAAGMPVGVEFLVNSQHTNFQEEPIIASLDGGGFVISWRTYNTADDGSGGAIKAQIYNFAGVQVGSEFLVNSQHLQNQIEPVVMGLDGGGFVISWRTYNTVDDGGGQAIKAQIYNALGVATGTEFLVNSQHVGDQADPTIASLNGGGFVISWVSYLIQEDGSGTAIKAQIFDGAGIPVGVEFLVNSQHASYQFEPTIASLDGGGFVISWVTYNTADDGGGAAIKAQLYNVTGAPIGAEFLVNSQHTSDQQAPTITGLDGGGFVISWRTLNSADDGSGDAVKAQIYNAIGVPIGTEFLVNSQHLNSQFAPTIGSLDGGGFVIGWVTFNTADDGSGTAIKARIYPFNNPAFNSTGVQYETVFENTNAPIQIGASNFGSLVTHNLTGIDAGLFALDANGMLTFVNAPDFENPSDNGADNQYDLVISSTSNGTTISRTVEVTVADVDSPSLMVSTPYVATGTEFLVNSQHADGQYSPTITGLDGGGFVIGWYTENIADDGDFGAIKVQKYDASGVAIGAEILVNDQHTDDQSDPSIASLDGGGFVVSWITFDSAADGSGTAIKAKIYNPAGVQVGNEFLVNSQTTVDQREPTIVGLDGGGFVIGWTTTNNGDDGSQYSIKAQIYNASGGLIGTEFLVNSQANGIQNLPTITSLDGGGFVISWQTFDGVEDAFGYGVKAQMYTGTGTKVGAEFLVNSLTNDTQWKPTIAGLDGGGYVISWESFDLVDDVDAHSIKAQMYDAAGAPVGTEFLVNSQHTSSQLSPTITGLDGGGFVISWYTQNIADDGDGFAIKAQTYNAIGVPIGTEFLVNSQHLNGQFSPTIGSLDGGGFVISWRTDNTADDGNGSAIKAQIYQPDVGYNYIDGETNDFNILAALPANQTNGTLSDVTITGIPAEATFTYVDGNNITQTLSVVSGTLILTIAQQNELHIKFDPGFNGHVDLSLSVTWSDNGNTETVTIITPINVGNAITGTPNVDVEIVTTGIDFVQLGRGIDSLSVVGVVATYTYEVVGNNLKIAEVGNQAINTDFLNSVELLLFDQLAAPIDVADLHTMGQISGMTSIEYDTWLSQNYNYDLI